MPGSGPTTPDYPERLRLAGLPDRHQLHHLFHDALSRAGADVRMTMFEFFFKYPTTVFAKGDLVFLSRLAAVGAGLR